MNLRLFIGLMFLFAVSECAIAAADRPWGMNSGLESDQIAEATKKLGVSWIRMTIYWSEVEKRKGVFDWSTPDVVIQRAAERGLNVYAIIHTTPAWASARHASNSPPKNSRDWARFVSVAAERYKFNKYVKAYGMWNEPNVSKFWSGTQSDYVRKILIPGYKAVKSVNRRLLVVAPELTHHWILQPEWWLWDINDKARNYYDVLALHFYPDAPYSFEHYLDKIVKPYRERKPVWITEIGVEGCQKRKCSLDSQSHTYLNFLRAQKKRSRWFRKIFPYRIWDPKDECNRNGNGFGLTAGDKFSERPAFQTYRDFIRRHRFVDPNPSCH